jgi:hypothetical protein
MSRRYDGNALNVITLLFDHWCPSRQRDLCEWLIANSSLDYITTATSALKVLGSCNSLRHGKAY